VTETFLDIIRCHFPNASDEEADGFLWNATCYPFACADRIIKDIGEMAAKSGGDINAAFAIAESEVEAAMRSLPTPTNEKEK